MKVSMCICDCNVKCHLGSAVLAAETVNDADTQCTFLCYRN
jgi:hypothetical protein